MTTSLGKELWPIRRASLVYPFPVAVASGRVFRVRSASERVNAVLKAAEVLTRYLAAISAASFATRSDECATNLTALDGNLSFGHFLTVVQEIAASQTAHPIAPLLAQGFKSKKQKDAVRGKTDAALVELLELRNALGHDLRNLDDVMAAAIETERSPCTLLAGALEGSSELLSKPLFVVEQQDWTADGVVMRHLLLMGESADPAPRTVKLEGRGVEFKQDPYVSINETCLHLPPWLLWGIDQKRKNFALLFLDGINPSKLRYCTVDGNEQRLDSPAELAHLREFYSGTRQQACTVVLVDGRSLAREWSDERKRIEEAAHHQAGTIDWSSLDEHTLSWYANLLGAAGRTAAEVVQEKLLDGRTSFKSEELRQLKLLFGTPATVRAELQRDVLDIRVIDPTTGRPSKRELIEANNLVEALKRATVFFAAHRGLTGFSPEDLRSSTGTVDYLTLREALVNQIIHQNYNDATTAGQIELHDEKVTVFNAGCSLVPTAQLLDGGKSQPRNPLIARALRLLGFAEISGSGIRAVHRACQQAKRKSPTFDSNEKTNTFTLTLDSAATLEDVDVYWNSLLGVSLTSLQATVLNALLKLPSATLSVLERETGLGIEQLEQALEFLALQVLVEQDESNYRLAPHLREKLG